MTLIEEKIMNRLLIIVLCFAFFAWTPTLEAGNPDRQGEAGAYELLLTPWARMAGLHSMNTSMVRGVEAMRLNPAGLSRINKTEFVIGHTRLYEGTEMAFNSIGLAQRMGKSGAFGLSLAALDFGDIPVTTTSTPGGTGANFSPSFFHLGISSVFHEPRTPEFQAFCSLVKFINISAFVVGALHIRKCRPILISIYSTAASTSKVVGCSV